MPNWCSNSVTISHSDPVRITELAQAMREGRFLKHVLPVPQQLIDTVAGSVGGPEDYEQRLLEFRQQLNREFFGYSNWYDFQVANWGTKWDVDCDGGVEVSEDGKTVTASFDSAWSPPIGIYNELVGQDYGVAAYYYEPGMCFVGKWVDGDDQYYEFGDHDSNTVRDVIGEELDDMFGISEWLAECEADQAE